MLFFQDQYAVKTYHPAKPQASLTGCAKGHVGRGDVWRSLKRLDLPGRLTWRTGANNVDLTHPEPEINETCC